MSVFSLESSISRLEQLEKFEFTTVNDHFESKHNEDNGLYGQTLIIGNYLSSIISVYESFNNDLYVLVILIRYNAVFHHFNGLVG